MISAKELKVKVFADGADLKAMKEASKNPFVKGLTTNPTLMRKAGVTDYKKFALEVLAAIPTLPVSFEVFSDDFDEMEAQAMEIASWGKNVYVKIPITNTKGEFAGKLIQKLANEKVQLNVTAIFTLEQVKELSRFLSPQVASIVSVFAGRIADTGRDPLPIMQQSLEILKSNAKAELLWASPRELLNIIQADEMGCHIITVTNDVIAKLALVGKDLTEFSLDTVKMFYQDAQSAGFRIEAAKTA